MATQGSPYKIGPAMVPMTHCVAQHHLTASPDGQHILLGDLDVTNSAGYSICTISSIQDRGDGGIIIIFNDSTDNIGFQWETQEKFFRNVAPQAPKLVEICKSGKAYHESPHYPLIVKLSFSFQIDEETGAKTIWPRSLSEYPDDFGLPTNPNSEAMFNFLAKKHILPGATFYKENCLNHEQQQAVDDGTFDDMFDNPYGFIPTTLVGLQQDVSTKISRQVKGKPRKPNQLTYYDKPINDRLLMIKGYIPPDWYHFPAIAPEIRLKPKEYIVIQDNGNRPMGLSVFGQHNARLGSTIMLLVRLSDQGESNGPDVIPPYNFVSWFTLGEPGVYNKSLVDKHEELSLLKVEDLLSSNPKYQTYNTRYADGLGLSTNPIPMTFNVIKQHCYQTPDTKYFLIGNGIVTRRRCRTIALLTSFTIPNRPENGVDLTVGDATETIDFVTLPFLDFEPEFWGHFLPGVEIGKDLHNVKRALPSTKLPLLIEFDYILKRWEGESKPRMIPRRLGIYKHGLSAPPVKNTQQMYSILYHTNMMKGADWFEQYCLTEHQRKIKLQQEKQKKIPQIRQTAEEPKGPIMTYIPRLDVPFHPIPLDLTQIFKLWPPKNKPMSLFWDGRNIANRIILCPIKTPSTGTPCYNRLLCYEGCKEMYVCDQGRPFPVLHHVPDFAPTNSWIVALLRAVTVDQDYLIKMRTNVMIVYSSWFYPPPPETKESKQAAKEKEKENKRIAAEKAKEDKEKEKANKKSDKTTSPTASTSTAAKESTVKKDQNDNNKNTITNNNNNNNNNNNTSNTNEIKPEVKKCSCPKQGCVLHGDEGYEITMKTKVLEDTMKSQDKTINDNKQYMNELQRKIEQYKQQLTTLQKQDNGTPWGQQLSTLFSSSQQTSSTSSSSSSKKQNNKNNNNTKNNNDDPTTKLLQQSVLYFKSNPGKYPKYIQDAMNDYKQRFTLLRQQIEQNRVLIKQHNQSLTSSRSTRQHQYQKLQDTKRQYDNLYTVLQHQHIATQKEATFEFACNQTLKNKCQKLQDMVKEQKQQQFEQQNKNHQSSIIQSNQEQTFGKLYHLLTKLSKKTQTKMNNLLQNNNANNLLKNTNNSNIHMKHELITNSIFSSSSSSSSSQQNNENSSMFQTAFCLSQPYIIMMPQGIYEANGELTTQATAQEVLSNSGILSNYILPTQQQVQQSLYNIYSYLHHHFTTPLQQSQQPLIYRDMTTLYESYTDIITDNQDKTTKQIKNVTKHNYIAYLLPHVEALYNHLTTSIVTQYNDTYYEQNYKQYYPDIKDYWKSIVLSSTNIMYHALLRLFMLISVFNNFDQTTTSLPLLSSSETTPKPPQAILSKQKQQYSKLLHATYKLLQQPLVINTLSQYGNNESHNDRDNIQSEPEEEEHQPEEPIRPAVVVIKQQQNNNNNNRNGKNNRNDNNNNNNNNNRKNERNPKNDTVATTNPEQTNATRNNDGSNQNPRNNRQNNRSDNKNNNTNNNNRSNNNRSDNNNNKRSSERNRKGDNKSTIPTTPSAPTQTITINSASTPATATTTTKIIPSSSTIIKITPREDNVVKECFVCFETETPKNNNNNNNRRRRKEKTTAFRSSTCCQKMIVCDDCIHLAEGSKCARCNAPSVHFL